MYRSTENNTTPNNDLEISIKEINSKIGNLTDSLEQGVNIKFIAERLDKLDKEKSILEYSHKQSQSKIAKPLDIEKTVSELMELSENAFLKLKSSHPQKIKEALRILIDRVEVDPKKQKALFYVNKIPSTSKSYGEILPVKKCRRPESNRHDVAIGGF